MTHRMLLECQVQFSAVEDVAHIFMQTFRSLDLGITACLAVQLRKQLTTLIRGELTGFDHVCSLVLFGASLDQDSQWRNSPDGCGRLPHAQTSRVCRPQSGTLSRRCALEVQFCSYIRGGMGTARATVGYARCESQASKLVV